MDINEFLDRYYSTLRIAQEVDASIDKNLFADYEKKLAALFFSRANLLNDFTFSKDNGKVKLKPKEGIINDAILKSIYENCKGAIDYIETLVQMYYSKGSEINDKYINTYLSHFFKVTERDVYYILSTPLAYGKHDTKINNNTKIYELLARVSFGCYKDIRVEFSDEEIELIIALISLREKLTKRGECNNWSADGTYMDLYYPTFDEWRYHSDLVDTIIENYPDIMKRLRIVAEKTNNTDLYKVYYLLQEHKEKRTIENIREVNNEEKEKYVSQLNLEITNSNGRDADAQDKLNNVKHNEQLKLEEERRKQRLNEVNKNIATIRNLLDTIRSGFNEYDVYMAQYIYAITNGNYNNLSHINPELYPHVQKPLEYLNLVTGTIKRVNGTLTNDEIKYVFDHLFRNLNVGQLLTTITKILERELYLIEPSLRKGEDSMRKYDLYYDPGHYIGVYKLPAFDVLVKQNPNLTQILEENGVKRINGGSDYRVYLLIEDYIKGQFLNEQKTLTSYIDNDTFQERQERIKKFLRSEQGNDGLSNSLTEESTNEQFFGRRKI